MRSDPAPGRGPARRAVPARDALRAVPARAALHAFCALWAAGPALAQQDAREDPFSRDTVLNAQPRAGGERAFIPAASLPADVPQLTLLGIARTGGAEALTALLEVKEMGVFVVRAGDAISLQRRRAPGASAADDVLRIKRISDQSVTVEAGSFGELIVVR